MCPVLQDFVMTYVAATRLRKACFNNTLNSVVNVENLVIPSYERLKFREVNGKTELTMVHSEIPTDQKEDLEKGWTDYYWTPMKNYFETEKRGVSQ